jgi:pyruvate/2-oxoglutarate dehydrogenase complex dihydrolipoamide dehydrogenase (E3) component
MADAFDVVVIGAGPAGEYTAGQLSDGGLTVAAVERRLVGGECNFWACIPSKGLVRPGDVLAAARRVPGAAEAVAGELDADAAFAFRDDLVTNYDDSVPKAFLDGKGVELVRGDGRLSGTRSVEVEAADGSTRTLSARQAVVLAIGSVPAVPPIEGLAEVRPWNSLAATAAKQLPRRLLVLGGGPVGVELAQAFKRLGSEEVTVIESRHHLLPREEPFACEELQAALRPRGSRSPPGRPWSPRAARAATGRWSSPWTTAAS